MDRRSSIKTILIFSAGVMAFPSCTEFRRSPSIDLTHMNIDGNDENLLNDIADTIIPSEQHSPGAKDVKACQFALMMLDDCYSSKDQKLFVNGIQEFNDFTNKLAGGSFIKASASQREQLLKMIESHQNLPKALGFMYNTFKYLVMTAFTQSEYYLTQVHQYVLVPGKFYGCVSVNQVS